jgi:threonine synthase
MYVTHLESALDGTRYDAGTVQTMHAGRPLLVRYDLDAIREAVSRDAIADRPRDMWRYRELLPVPDDVVSLGEAMTPVIPCPSLGAELGLTGLFIKDESRLPTGSFKARGMAVAITMARHFGLRRVALPTAGNAGGAAAAYAARAGIECFVFMPADTPDVNKYEVPLLGAKAYLIDGHIGDCGALVEAGKEPMGWFSLATLKEPYRLEGKKTMGLEVAEQFDWKPPDAIFYPTGGGTGLIGMWKAFSELTELGWIQATPRLYACQSSGCAPLAGAFASGERFATPVERPSTIAAGLCVPGGIGDFLCLDAVRATGGAVLTADEGRLREWMGRASAAEGVSLCPEAAACLDGLEQAVADGLVGRDERVVVFNTGAAQKYVEVLRRELPRLDRETRDWSELGRVGGV